MILIVTYDLRTPKDYHDFYEVVKAQGKWWHYMASTWLLSTDRTPQQVAEAIQEKLDPQDLFFVCELAPQYQGRLPKPAWDWINSELKAPFDLAALAGLSSPGPSAMPPPPPPLFGELDWLTKLPPSPKK
jgi:hypothetical protein